ncbi:MULTISPECIES: hypothetical protein [unclassified Streptococcus]|uniref:hypothetical protein n=1 Tax=unclassified Streptococcus TaxID=2608887 RepID=UPI00211B4183|nr:MULTISPECIES: hypothetical protein [unclassified Streptococcus]MCQ9212850.1 hypothetical protein [Streptococcus sp. B01]MCQ9212939.1 hypothetical protein [Streptococcus sp. O1]MCQ9215017.1 hypothetical protein [Streptococcus sp. O1]
MVRDMLAELWEELKQDEVLSQISIKSFERPESLEDTETSVVIIPLGPPMQAIHGSNTSLAKTYLYQINVESVNALECKELQRRIEKILERRGFYQTAGGLDIYLTEIKRYVDARTYRGNSPLYEDY